MAGVGVVVRGKWRQLYLNNNKKKKKERKHFLTLLWKKKNLSVQQMNPSQCTEVGEEEEKFDLGAQGFL